MLDSPEEHVLQSACEALYKFSEKCKFHHSDVMAHCSNKWLLTAVDNGLRVKYVKLEPYLCTS